MTRVFLRLLPLVGVATFTLAVGTCQPDTGGTGSIYLGVDGDGIVTADPPLDVARRGQVTLTATPAEGWAFDRWGGDVDSSTNPLTVTLSGDQDVYAFFSCPSCGGVGDRYQAGKTYMGRNEYIEYKAGDLPIVISAPHGGYMTPDEIPDRTYGTTISDGFTEELARQVYAAIHAATGKYPHMIICRLDRVKLDANRDLEEGAQGDAEAVQAWEEFHGFITSAKQRVVLENGKGLYLDLHGQSDDPEHIQLGYLLYSTDLAKSDAALNDPAYADKSSLRSLYYAGDLPFSELLRGAPSIGGLLEAAGYHAVPSPVSPDPGRTTYYTGGYNTATHGSQAGGTVDGLLMETNMSVRQTEEVRAQFASDLTQVLRKFLAERYGIVID